MEALAISAANLDTIEKNLGNVAHELSGVINNVSSVDNKINKVEEKVANINDEIKNLIQEIRETTIITNARQSIMYNNEIIEKKFGYHDKVRRNVEALLTSLNSITDDTLINLRQKILLENPSYWLSSALSSLISWLLNDKATTQRELDNALKYNKEKTSLFFALVYLQLGRQQTSLNWLEYYLSQENPIDLDQDFIIVLDLITNNTFKTQGIELITNKISNWLKIINQQPQIINNEKIKWVEYIQDNSSFETYYPNLETYSKDINIIKTNLAITSSYENVYNKLTQITNQQTTSKPLQDIFKELIYDYEVEEKIFQKDNLRNKLLIEYNGNQEKVDELLNKHQSLTEDKMNILSLFNNIVMYPDKYQISDNTKKLALSYIKHLIIESYELLNEKVKDTDITLQIDDLNFTTSQTKEQLTTNLNNYLETKYQRDDKLITTTIIINILSIVILILTLNNQLIRTLSIIITIIADIFLIYKIVSNIKLTNNLKNNQQQIIKNKQEITLAEFTDYKDKLKHNQQYYNNLNNYLNTINTNNYIKTTNQRNIEIGDN